MQVQVGPESHISTLAALHTYCIQMIDPYDLKRALDFSTDLNEDYGDTMQETFPVLLDRKYENCSEWFTTNLATLGVQEPLVIIIYSDGRWVMDEGHHRLAWALLNEVHVPVIFDDTGADDDSHMGYLVARANVDAYHDTVPADVELIAAVESAIEDAMVELAEEVKAEAVFIPAQRGATKHRAGGRHRA